MPVDKQDFFLEVFRQSNEHMRATDRKYWITATAFIGMIALFITRMGADSIVVEKPMNPIDGWVVIVGHWIICLFGLFVFTMQSWFRTWKEHYIHIAMNLRKELIADDYKNGQLPYWLVDPAKTPKYSIDNSVSLLIFILNVALGLLAAGEIFIMTEKHLAGIIVAGLLFTIYVVLLVIVHICIRHDKQLSA